MRRLLFLTLLRPVRVVLARFQAPEAHAPNATPRRDASSVVPSTQESDPGPRRRDWMRAVVGLPALALTMPVAAVGFGSLTGCETNGGTSLAETEVDSFTVGQTTGDGMTLEQALRNRAEQLGVTAIFHHSTCPDGDDCLQSIMGWRLVRWDYRQGSSTDARYYRFEVNDEDGYAIGNTPSLGTILRRGYTVVVMESVPAGS